MVLLALKVTSQLLAQLVIAHKSEFKKFAAVGGESTTILLSLCHLQIVGLDIQYHSQCHLYI